jgi:cytochrome c-type biogenesis protein
VDATIIGFALSAGLVAAVNPCGFAMLPGYLALVVLGEEDDGERSLLPALGRATAATVAMALGFLVVFGTFGLVVAPLAGQVQQYLPAVTVLIGVLLVALGGWLLSGRELTVLLPKPSRGAPTRRIGSMFGYGLAYAVASLGCTIGPFLAVTSATFRAGSTLDGVVAYLAYGAGMALVVGVLAVGFALAGSTAARYARQVLPYVNRISGVLLVLVGLYVGYYGVYELRLFHGDGDAADPVVDAAGVVQRAVANWVDSIGVWPLLVALAALVVLAVLAHRMRARARGRTS